MRSQRGVIGMLILLVLVLAMVAVLATYAVSRITGSTDEVTTTSKRLQRIADALEQFAATGRRLPCPANPAVDTGLEVLPAVNAATCSFAGGTVPWRTIGLAHDDAYDAWNRKISYRVYTGNQGSFTQPGGVSMVECDSAEATPGGVTAVAAGAGGLCRSSTDPYQRNTTPAQFMAGKGLSLTDSGVNYTDVAYVLLSHGSTGLGAYTIAGNRLDLPAGDERNNTQDAGPFTVKAFSDPDTGATSAQHFDDLVAYRRIEELSKRASLAARDWPEGATFNQATMLAATGSGVYRDNVGNNFSFMGNTYRASGGTGSFTFTTSGGTEGVGVSGGANNMINNAEIVRVELAAATSRFAFTLSNFGKLFSSTSFREQLLLRFYNSSGVQITPTMTKQACIDDGSASTFQAEPPDPGTTFRYVEIEGQPNTFGFFNSSFLLSEVAACGTAGTCDTTLAASSTRCAGASLTNNAFSPASITRPASSTLTFTLANGTDNAAQNGIAWTGAFPAYLAFANTTVGGTCGGTLQSWGGLWGTVTAVDTSTETITLSGAHNSAVGKTFYFSSGSPPSPLALNTVYTIKSTPAANQITVDTGTGSTVNLTSAATGAGANFDVTYKLTNLSLGNNVASCTVSLSLTSATAGSYTPSVTATANLTNSLANAPTLAVQ